MASRIEPPTVRSHDKITQWVFDQMARAIRACRLIAGPNIRLRETPDGTVISAIVPPATFAHPWLVDLQGATACTMLPGTINGVPATIDGEPLDGGPDNDPPPVLEWDKPQVDGNGRGFICAEVTCNPKANWGIISVEIVQVADPDTEDGTAQPSPGLGQPAMGARTGGSAPISGNRSRHPLAMLRLRDDGRLDCFAVTYFPLNHRVRLAANNTDPIRHYFY